MSEWKKVKIDFETVKLGDYIEPIKTTVGDLKIDNPVVYGVTNKEGIVQTGKPASEDVSKYIVLQENCFAFNPYRINVGSIGINEENLKGCVSPAYVVFKTKNGLLPKFLFFYLKSDYGIHLINWYGNRGGVRNALRYSDLCNIDIPDIRKLDQQALLDKFSFAAERIDELSKEIEKQKSYAKKLRANILQDAIEGKLTADWREKHPVKKGDPNYDSDALFEKIQAEKQEKGKKQKPLPAISDDEKPFAIPTGWKWVRLGDLVIDITSGSREWAKYYSESGALFLRMGNLSKNSFNLRLDNLQYVNVPDNSEGKRTRLQAGDLLFSITADIGNLGLIPENFQEAYINQHTARIRFLERQRTTFFPYVLLSPCLKSQYLPNAHGMKNSFRLDTLSFLKIPLPPLAEQNEIVARVEKHLETITQLETQIATRETLTKQLMQGLLKDAFER